MTVPVTAWYTPGSWIAVAGPRVWLMADVAPDSPLVGAWSRAAARGDGVDVLLGVAVDEGLRAVRSFVVAEPDATGIRIVLRGDAHLVRADGQAASGFGSPTWVDQHVDGQLLPVRLAGGPESTTSLRLPVAGGVVFASCVDIYAAEPVTADEPGREVRAASAAPVAPGPAPAQPVDPVEPVEPVESPPALGVPAAVPPVPGASVPEVEAPSSEYAHLFGATVHPRPLPADVLPSDVTLFPPPEPTDTPPAPSEVVPEPAADPAGAPAADIPTGLIDSVPWWPDAGTAQPAYPAPAGLPQGAPSLPHPVPTSVPAAPAPVPVTAEPSVEHTVNRAALAAVAAAVPDAPAVGPTVLAAWCPARHLSAAFAHACRVCDLPISPQDPLTIARPVLGALRLPGGQLVQLDRGVVLGRSPQAAEGDGGERPHAVALPSPENDISRNHAEIRLDGWNVMAVDLGSTNGTVVILPGRAPIRLHAGEPLLLERGSVVTLADEVSVTFEIPA